jgi:hypothetical protein
MFGSIVSGALQNVMRDGGVLPKDGGRSLRTYGLIVT